MRNQRGERPKTGHSRGCLQLVQLGHATSKSTTSSHISLINMGIDNSAKRGSAAAVVAATTTTTAAATQQLIPYQSLVILLDVVVNN